MNNEIQEENIGQKYDDFEILETIHSRNNNFVAKVKSKLNNQIYSMKKIDLNNSGTFNIMGYTRNEVPFLKLLNHENIIKYYTSFEENNCLYIITEYVNNKNLLVMIHSLKNNNSKINEEKLSFIIYQCLKLLSYLHSNGIIFRGFKPDAILIDENNIVKIANFKYAAIYDYDLTQKKFGNIDKNILRNSFEVIEIGDYKAPEMIKGKKYDYKVDVYSMGIVFCCLAFFDFKLPNQNEIYSNELYDLISKMIISNPAIRPSSQELYQDMKDIYITKYFHNTGLFSSIRCLASFPNVDENILKEIKPKENSVLYYMVELLEKIINSKTEKEKKLALYNLDKILKEQKIISDRNYQFPIIEFTKYIFDLLDENFNIIIDINM